MDDKVMELRLQQWLPIFEEQINSGLNKQDFCEKNGIKRAAFFKWQRVCRTYLLAKNSNTIKGSDESAFVEISCNNPSSNEVVKSDSDNKYDNTSSVITVSYNGFCVGVTGIVNESNLTKVLRAITHAN